VNASDEVLSGGTAPYGDLPGGARMPPAEFVRELLCLRGPELIAERCSDPAHFDILDHHPYSVAGPGFHALNRDDVAIADMSKLTGPLRRAERLGLVAGARRHQVWVTELGWNSAPPERGGVPLRTQARWLEQSLELLSRAGVSTVLWYLIVDAAPLPAMEATFQASGLYLRGGAPKPSAQAFRFPFTATRVTRTAVLVWARAPAHGAVRIERRQGRRWRLLRTVPGAPGHAFAGGARTRRPARLRTSQGPETSLVWGVRG
jgi:hypothetical protein